MRPSVTATANTTLGELGRAKASSAIHQVVITRIGVAGIIYHWMADVRWIASHHHHHHVVVVTAAAGYGCAGTAHVGRIAPTVIVAVGGIIHDAARR